MSEISPKILDDLVDEMAFVSSSGEAATLTGEDISIIATCGSVWKTERDSAAAIIAQLRADLEQARQERSAANVRGDTYRRRALALARLCQRLENGERILGTGFAVGAARRFVADEMTARCADCGQMIMLTVQEYIKRNAAAHGVTP